MSLSHDHGDYRTPIRQSEYLWENDKLVPFCEPAEATEPAPETPPREWDTFLSRVLDVLKGPPSTSAIRVAALELIAGDKRTLSEIAYKIGCSVSTLHDAKRRAEAKLFPDTPKKFQR